MEITRCDFCSEDSCEFCHKRIHTLTSTQKEFITNLNKELIDKVKSLLLEHTYYDSRDDITFMDNINFEVISEELDELVNYPPLK